MFFCKNCHGFIKNNDIVNAAFFSAFAFVMNNATLGKIIIFVSTLRNSIG